MSTSVKAQKEPELTETEWRMIHNALALRQITYWNTGDDSRAADVQLLMNKVRDVFIAPFCETEKPDISSDTLGEYETDAERNV